MDPIRKIDRVRGSCELSATLSGRWIVPTRQAGRCDAPVVNPNPQFIELSAQDLAGTPVTVPDALVLFNTDFTLACHDVAEMGPFGASVNVPNGVVSQQLYWLDVPDITDAQLTYLTGLEPDNIDNLIQDGVSVSIVKGITKLHQHQAEWIVGQLVILRASVQDATYTYALSQLRCVWKNTTQTAACPDADAAHTNQSAAAIAAGVHNPSVVPAGTYESTDSQAAANNTALLDAQRQLTCLHGNDAVTRICEDLGYQETIPTDTTDNPATPQGRLRIGSAFVEVDSFFASTKAAAQRLAETAADVQLDCFFVNAQQVVACSDKNAELAGAFVQAVDYDTQLTGNPVTVRAGRIVLTETSGSQEAADAAARNAGLAFLDCRFRNVEVVVQCPTVVVGSTNLEPANPTRTITVPAGEVEARTQAEADALAREIGLLQLNCQYCNAFIPPACYPPSYTPEAGKAIPETAVTPDWSSSVILGLAAGTVCMDDPTQVPTVANVIAVRRPDLTAEGCVYLNDEMWFGCLDVLPGSPTLPRGGYHAPQYLGNTTLPAGYEGTPLSAQLSPYCTPDIALGAASYFVVRAGSYPITTSQIPPAAQADPKRYANEQARLFGLVLIRCAFGNPELDLNCQTAFPPDTFVQTDVAQSNGETVTVQIPKARHESAFSFRQALEAAKLEAQSLLTCYYENPEIVVRCWTNYGVTGSYPSYVPEQSSPTRLVYGDGQATRTWESGGEIFTEAVTLQEWQFGSIQLPVVVPRGTFQSLRSLADATQQALNYALASLDCAAQARDTTVCNDPLLIFCGAFVESNPAAPFQSGTGALVANGVPTTGGRLRLGDGHNYVMIKQDLVWVRTDTGCSEDPVGGCTGTGLQVPACIASGRTREEANLLAYQLMRTLLTCTNSADIAGLGGEGAAGAPGNDGAQNECSSACLAVYS